MIKTTFDENFDIKAAIPEGARVGILGCSSCAAVCRTGDTERIEEVRTLIDGHCEVILSTSVDSPCDQRVLRYLSKTFPQFDEVEVFVALACEAGSRSLGCLVSAMVISPLKTESFSIRSIHGKSKSACLFCDECSFPDKSVQCPVSSCPIGKTDGPCQNRTSEGCVVDEGERCVWLDVPVLVPVSQKVSIPSENSLSFPAFLIPSPDSLKDSGKLVSFLKNKNVSTLFVAPSENGISPLVLIGILKEMMEGVTFGLCLNGSDKNDIALASDLVTAAALGVEYIFLKEYHRPTSRKMAYSSTVELIELIKEKNESFTIIVENAFLHESDFFLLDTQIEGGASLVVSSFGDACLKDRARTYSDMSLKLLSVAEGDTLEGDLSNSIIDLTPYVGEALFEIG